MTQIYPTSMDRVEDLPGASTVGVIMRTRNRPVLLARALNSVINQEYKDWQLVIVNDGGQREPVDELIDQYRAFLGDRIEVIHNPRSIGMEVASNAGLKCLQRRLNVGYLCVHDDDDSWHPQFLSKCIAYLDKEPEVAAVMTQARLKYERLHGDLIFRQDESIWSVQGPFLKVQDMMERNHVPPICLVTRMSVVRKIGQFNEELPVLGDWEFTLRVLMEGEIGVISDLLANYHHRPDAKGADANSVHGWGDKHKKYQVLLVNSMVRQFIRDNPGHIGLLHLMFSRISDLKSEVVGLHFKLDDQKKNIDTLHQRLDQVVNILSQTKRPWWHTLFSKKE